MSEFYDKLDAMADQGKFLCVGLDPRPDRFPEEIKQSSEEVAEQALLFGSAIVESVQDVAAAIKPNEAFWQALAAEGVGTAAYEQFVADVEAINPELVIIGDAKRSDIGDTAGAYARSEFDDTNVDALTVIPYFGSDAAKPFWEYENKGIIPVIKSSNPDGSDTQSVPAHYTDLATMRRHDGSELYDMEEILRLKSIFGSVSMPQYAHVGSLVRRLWNANNNIGVVAGGSPSSLDDLSYVRAVMGEDIPILVPGIGKQGGSAREAATLASNRIGSRFLINESRSVIYASTDSDYYHAARDAAVDSTEQIREGLREVA